MFLTSFAAGPLQANCYVFAGEDHRCVVIDPGVNAVEPLDEILAAQGLDMVAVLLTHGHPDHVGSAADVADAHRVPAYLHQADRSMFDAQSLPDWAREIIGRFDVNHTEPADLRLLQGGETVDLGPMHFTVDAAPGHSPGSVLWRTAISTPFPQAPELTELVFCGDVVFAGAIGRTDLPGSDPDAMMETLRSVILPLPDGAALLPGHGPETVMARERATNQFLQPSYLR
ncbi:MAG: MBL fold metallo-hydrolase [Propioniciclava sp.]